jgi:hypothetical protein
LIYFLKAERDGGVVQAGWIKIGTTTRLTERLKQIAAEIGHTPIVLAVLDGGFAEEQALHRKFGFAGRFREWFDPDPELLLLIETDGRPWDGTDEIAKQSLISLKGTVSYEKWIDGLVDHAHQGTRTLLLKNALREFAENHGYKVVVPKR